MIQQKSQHGTRKIGVVTIIKLRGMPLMDVEALELKYKGS